MQEFFRSLPPVEILSHLVCLVIVVLAFLTFLIVWVPVQWRLHRRTELEAALKQDMLNRGMSAEEIERVLKTSLPEGAEPPVTADVGPLGSSSTECQTGGRDSNRGRCDREINCVNACGIVK